MNRRNPIKNTFCIFYEVDMDILKDKTPDYISKSKSVYFYSDEGVYRISNHWGRAANSKWRLEPLVNNASKSKAGFAKWGDFHRDNDIEKLYFIEADYVKNSVTYNHKNNKRADSKAVLRTAPETTKIIKQIRNLMADDKWTRYFETEDIVQKVIDGLITSDKNLLQVKAEFD